MRRAFALTFLLALAPAFSFAQSQQRAQTQQKPDSDRLGLSCAQILQMSSSEWVAKITSIDDSTVDGNLRGIRAYGNCYDQRTDRLAATLAKSGKGPLMGARANFRDFEGSLQSFTAKALAVSQPPADAVKSAYAGLYEKQFRYAFYQSYDQRAAKSSSPSAPKSTPPSATTPTAPTAPPAAKEKDVDPVTLAKNHFGEFLGELPDDQMHSLHAAFGEILAANPVGRALQLPIYRYAIFLLESKSDQPFAPPPF